MEFLIITGLSGAGKSRAAMILEDMDFYCVDNMPIEMIPRFAELCLATRGRYEKVALVTDIRERGDLTGSLASILDDLETSELNAKILFIEASDNVITRRYKESRRKHPLAPDGIDIETALKQERQKLAELRGRADFIIDTTDTSPAELARRLTEIFSSGGTSRFRVNVISFGFKYSPPVEADMILDVRFLPNPHYIPELSPKTGQDAEVSEFVLTQPAAIEFTSKLNDLVSFLLPHYIEEGKQALVIAIGCTGGRHRSVAIAEQLSRFITELGYNSSVSHRDITK
ncbi:MAG: RNase adapter RapZ [Oscillospiraceae bacterium]|jgi:UPF0042 nucleotide-binding protein|nr:RNase adapter RapZ [Oscillospiraceae bacterium]